MDDRCHARSLLIGVVALAAFVGWELRSTHPMLDPRFFRIRRFSLGSLTITAAFFGIFAMFFVLTQFLQFVQQHDALAAGLRILPYGLVLLVVAPRAASLTGRFGDRPVTVSGMTIAAAGFATLGFLEPDSSYLVTAIGLVLVAIGTGLLMPPATTAIVASLPPSKAGVGSAVNDTTREIGGAVGIAVGGVLLSSGYRNGIDAATADLPEESRDVARDSLGALLAMPEAQGLADAGRSAFTDGMQLTMFGAAGLLVASAVLVAAMYPHEHPTPTS